MNHLLSMMRFNQRNSDIKEGKTMKTFKQLMEDVGLNEAKKEDVNESESEQGKHAVYLHGGIVGNKGPSLIKVHDTKELAVAQAKRMNNNLSKGERLYYKMKFKVVPYKED